MELFAGTYQTALGLSRTFILPDSPQTLELQLQGDDLVEVFLVFPQNVFGLEPVTVRVREVRIGRAERRAARQRAARSTTASAAPEDMEDVKMNVVVGTGLPVSSNHQENMSASLTRLVSVPRDPLSLSIITVILSLHPSRRVLAQATTYLSSQPHIQMRSPLLSCLL